MISNAILDFASQVLGAPNTQVSLMSVSGGDINQNFTASTSLAGTVFIKTNESGDVLLSEYNALCRLQELGASYYPKVLSFECIGAAAFLALEYSELATIDTSKAVLLAEALRSQHSITADRFGWQHSGHIGYSVQTNKWSDDWILFFNEMRLLPQLRAAKDKGLSSGLVARVERIMASLAVIIDGKSIKPSLLHGDLWTGNVGFDGATNQPLFFDPAPYFGDPEVDIAMTRLFGCLPNAFYDSFYGSFYGSNERQMYDQSNDERHAVYNLYHALNHFNMFGAGFAQMVDELCFELPV